MNISAPRRGLYLLPAPSEFIGHSLLRLALAAFARRQHPPNQFRVAAEGHRQTHAAGERLFVDYAGDGVPVVIDRLIGEIRMAQIFVAVLGASIFTFAKASWTQTLPDWFDAHVRAFEAIGGVAAWPLVRL